jgi:hypothetical protein
MKQDKDVVVNAGLIQRLLDVYAHLGGGKGYEPADRRDHEGQQTLRGRSALGLFKLNSSTKLMPFMVRE